MLHSLNSVINQDVALSCNMASYKTWSEGTGQNASLDVINDKCESAKDEVSYCTFYALEIADYDGAALIKFISFSTVLFFM